jgi:hypothetical protein
MAERLFSKYPVITYDGLRCLDISRRVKLTREARANPNLFYPLEMKSGMRADSLADAYYEDSYLDWMLYLSNEIVDPYYQWYLSESDFRSFITEKYGTLEYAMEHIKFYRNNWSNDDTELTPSYYENNLPYDQKQYFSPTYGQNNKIISYVRKKQDWTTNTNKILEYTVSYTGNSVFSVGEIVDFKYAGENVGTGEVVTANSLALIVKNVSGNVVANSTWTKEVIGEVSGTIANTAAYNVLQENITNATGAFWTAVSFFDWENEINESKKLVTVVNGSYVLDIAENLRLKMQE